MEPSASAGSGVTVGSDDAQSEELAINAEAGAASPHPFSAGTSPHGGDGDVARDAREPGSGGYEGEDCGKLDAHEVAAEADAAATEDLPPEAAVLAVLSDGVAGNVQSAPDAPDQHFSSLVSLMTDKKLRDRELLDAVFNTLVGGSFDVETNFIIADAGRLLQLQRLVETCPEKLQAEIWSMLNGLLRKSRLNQLTCTEARFTEYILNHLQMPGTSNLVADLLLDTLTILAGYSFTVKELQLLLSYLRVSSPASTPGDRFGASGRWPPHALQVLQALRHMPHRRGCDEYFCFPGLGGAAISLPPIAGARWPYLNGWTFSTWVYLDEAPSANDSPATPYLYCFQSKQEVGYTAHIVGSSLVVTCSRSKGKAQQHRVQYDFQPRQWYMITITHVYNRWKACQVKCYINTESVSTSEFPWAFTLPEQFDRCFIGGCANLDRQGAFCGQMSAMYVFNEAVQPNIIEALYAIGPSYKGQFKFESECSSHVEDRHKKALFDGKLTASVVLMYSPTACHSNICLESSPKGNSTVFAQAPHAMMIGGVKAVLTRSIHAALHSLGGIQVIYPLFGQLDIAIPGGAVNGGGSPYHKGSEICSMLMGLVCDLVETSTTVQQQMALSRGFLVIGHYLEKADPGHLSENVLGCFIRLAKFFASPAATEAPHCDTLLKQLNDYIFFNPALWINAPVKVQMVMYHFLAFQYLELAPLFGIPARRVSAVIQIFNAFKFYYYLVNPLDRSGLVPEVAGHSRPRVEDLVRLREIMLLFIDNLIGRYGSVIDDEMESMLNYLIVMNEVDNVYDVLCKCVSFMDKYAASMVPAFDRKHGMNALFKLLASPSEPLRVQALKLLALFLARSTARRKNEAMLVHNLYSLLSNHLLLHAKFISLNIYACLVEVLTERVSLLPAVSALEHSGALPLDLSCRIENPAILKVISSLIKDSTSNQEVLEVRQLFLVDLLTLCENSPENRRCILQMSVWQDWLFSLAYIYPGDPVQEAVTADVLSVFRLLLFHAIRVEYGGWRVWIDTMAIVHARVSHEDFQIHVTRLHQQQQLQQPASLENAGDSGSGGKQQQQQASLSADPESAPISPAASTSGTATATVITAAGSTVTAAGDGQSGTEKHASSSYDAATAGSSSSGGPQSSVAAAAAATAPAPAMQKQRVTFNAAQPRAAPFRIPEFRWSHLHQYLLSDLLLTLDQDVSSWKDKNDKMAQMETVNDSENAIYAMNTVNIISHLSDVLITAAGGLLPLLSAATSASGHIDVLEPGYGLTIQNAVAYLLRVLQLSDIMVMSSSVPLRDLETEKSMNQGTILRQCLRIVSTAVVRNCLECRRASGYYSGVASGRRSSAAAAAAASQQQTAAPPPPPAHAQRHPDPVLALIEGARTRIGEQEEPQPAVDDVHRLFQDADLTRLKSVLYRDTEDAKQTEWLVLATVYFMSVLMVSKYRDLLDPPPGRSASMSAKHSEATEKRATACPPVDPAGEAAAARAGTSEATADERQQTAGFGQLPHKDWHREPGGSVTVPNAYSDSDDDDPLASLGTSLSVSVDVHSPASIRALPPSQPPSPSSSSSSSSSTSNGASDAAFATAPEAVDAEGASMPRASEATTENTSDQMRSVSLTDSLPVTVGRPVQDDQVAREQEAGCNEGAPDFAREQSDQRSASSLPLSVPPVVNDPSKSQASQLSSDSALLSSEQESRVAPESSSSEQAASSSARPSGSAVTSSSSSVAMISGQEGSMADPALTATSGGTSTSATTTASSTEERSDRASTSASSSELRSQSDDTSKSISSIWLRTASQSRDSVEAPVRDAGHEKQQPKEEELPADFDGGLSSLAELPATAFTKRPSTDVSNLSERLERALGTAAPVLKDILLEFSSFLSKRLIGSKGQELLSAAGLTAVRESQSAIELVMLLCSQEWQLSLQKHAGLAFIELVNEGRLLSHATRNHVVRVANEAEFILNKLRAEDVQKHAGFAAICAQSTHRLRQEEKTCDHLISSVKHRDFVMAVKIITKANTIYWCSRTFGDGRSDRVQTFWKLDAWEDDSRRRRRLVPNVVGSTHPEATLRAALEQGATEEAVAEARENVLTYIAAQKRHLGVAAASILPKQESLDGSYQTAQNSALAEMPDVNAGDPESRDAEAAAEPVVLSTSCKLVCLGIDIIGTLSISRSELFFEVDDESEHNKKLDSKVLAYAEHLHGRWSFSDIYAIFGRKYLLQNTAVEVFMSNRSSVMFAFSTQKIVKQVVSLLPRVGIGSKYGLPHTRQVSLAAPMQLFKMSDMMQKWRRREISNFDYLMFLNTVAGRTYCDINQYPIYPWVLVNYDSDELDLNQASNYRDLSKPVGALNPGRRAYFDERYSSWGQSSGDVPPFHYGSHYSTASLVLGWLLRVEPYATMYLSLQGGKFDYPNRTFASVLGAWKSCQSDTADVKELIPEFYSLPEMFINSNRFKMGKLDDGTPVDDVLLPPWAANADDFVRICRQALESEIVSCQLHEWIDLIFGYKQRGPEAVRSTNVFYYLSYEGSINVEGIKDAALREAIESQIRLFGQTPAQLLLDPHPPRGSVMHLTPRIFAPARAEVCMILKFLTNSATVHLSANTHPHTSNPAVVSIFQNRTFAANKWTAGGPPTSPTTAESRGAEGPGGKEGGAGSGVPLPVGLDPVLLTPNSNLRRNLGENFDERMQLQRQHFTVTADNRSLLACGFWDASFRVFSVDTGKVTQVIFGHFDIVTCLSHSEVNTYHDCYVVTGSRDCTCMVWQWSGTQQRIINSDPTVQVSHSNLVPMSTLNGHLSEVICCLVTSELGFVVSASADGACLMHTLGGDLLRALERDQAALPSPSAPLGGNERSGGVPPHALLINREGFILALYGRAELCLFSLSGRFLVRRVFGDTIKCLSMSSDGQHALTGGENGVLTVLRTHDLSVLYAYASCNAAIHDVAISHDQRYVMAGLGTGSIVVYNIDFTRWQRN